jgi:hypothetical protein
MEVGAIMYQVDIFNLALSRLGKKTVASATENDFAKACNSIYEPLRQAILRDHNWKFSTKIIPLAECEDTIPGWTHIYSYPSDCLYARKVFNASTPINTPGDEFDKLQSGLRDEMIIVTNTVSAYLEYTVNVINTNFFDASFIDAFGWKLAGDLAIPLTGKADLASGAVRMYELVIANAKAANLSEGYLVQEQTSSYVNVRG